jgi:NAD(P)-dependent dehydrogenase (short-subunit alcohol dehydrogenase family)
MTALNFNRYNSEFSGFMVYLAVNSGGWWQSQVKGSVMDKKNIFVVGGSSGIGLELVKFLSDNHFQRLTIDDFKEDFNINLLGAVKVIQGCLKRLKKSP